MRKMKIARNGREQYTTQVRPNKRDQTAEPVLIYIKANIAIE